MKDNNIVNMELPDNHVLIINDSTYKRLEEFAEKGDWGNMLEADPCTRRIHTDPKTNMGGLIL